MKLFIIIAICLAALSCKAAPPQQVLFDQRRIEGDNLSQQTAFARSEQVSKVEYDVQLFLDGTDSFKGKAGVSFNYQKGVQDLTLDLSGADIFSVRVNEKDCKYSYNKSFIRMPPTCLANGLNNVEVQYSRKHDTSGDGFHRNVDSNDGLVYLYTDFEPYNGNKLFPMFDQPDIKANLTLAVDVPASWQVISNEKEIAIQDYANVRRWLFPKTPLLSTYVMGLHAGPYFMWTDVSGQVPLRIFSRQSAKDKIDYTSWFFYTKQGIDFFQNYFSIQFPFSKYDQVLVPDYLWDAMETSSAVTFSEQKYAKPLLGYERLNWINVVMHELAHHWYGNFSTMKWWDDLWLNESLATFFAYNAVLSLKEFSGQVDLYFYTHYKVNGYAQDRGPSSHEISPTVADTDAVMNSIDAITYGKGASAFKQLSHFLGEYNFRKGITEYLKLFSYKNATREDFIRSLERSSGQSLRKWQNEWLLAKGTNDLHFSYKCQKGKISEAILSQTQEEQVPLRDHRIQLGLYAFEAGQLKLISSYDVVISEAKKSLFDLVGSVCPAYAYPNQGDWTFARVIFDTPEIDFLTKHITDFGDPLLRAMLWRNLWDNTLQGNIAIDAYLEIVAKHIARESDPEVLALIGSNLAAAFEYLDLMKANVDPTYDSWVKKYEDLAWQNMLLSLSQQQKRYWLELYITIARSTDSAKKLDEIYVNRSNKARSIIDDRDVLLILEKLSGLGYAKVKKYIAEESNTKPYIRDQLRAALLLYPDIEAKKQWFFQVASDTSDFSLATNIQILKKILPSYQTQIRSEMADDLWESLPVSTNKKNLIFKKIYSKYAILNTCSKEGLAMMESDIAKQQFFDPILNKAANVGAYEQRQCLLLLNKRS